MYSCAARINAADCLTCCAAIPQDQSGQLDLLKPRLVFCAVQMAGLIFALNKLQGMGLLPTNPSDYVSFLQLPVASEFAGSGVSLNS